MTVGDRVTVTAGDDAGKHGYYNGQFTQQGILFYRIVLDSGEARTILASHVKMLGYQGFKEARA